MGSRSSPTTFARGERKAIYKLQRRSWLVNMTPDKQRKALGRGLSALLPQRPTATAAEPGTEPVDAR